MSDRDIDLFDVEGGVSVYMEYEDAVDAFDRDLIDASPLMDSSDRYPLVAEGFFSNDGMWMFFKVHHRDSEYRLEYGEFVEALEETA